MPERGMDIVSSKPSGLRARKRQETLERIAETGLRLFSQNGYEATTLDAIAEGGRNFTRTFFHYFKSKEEILLDWQLRGSAHPFAGCPSTACRKGTVGSGPRCHAGAIRWLSDPGIYQHRPSSAVQRNSQGA